MEEHELSEITRILNEWSKGDKTAEERLLPLVYDELKRQARIYMSKERRTHTLQPTALVNEAFLKLTKQKIDNWESRNQFYAITARLMRQILVDYARTKTRKKRGGSRINLSLTDLSIPVEERAASVLALDDALNRLAEFDERQHQVVEMRFFGGLTTKEIADLLNVSQRTIERDWSTARLWLYRELSD